MKIQPNTPPVVRKRVTSRETEPGVSFTSLLAGGQTTQGISSGRAFGFAETGMFGAIGGQSNKDTTDHVIKLDTNKATAPPRDQPETSASKLATDELQFVDPDTASAALSNAPTDSQTQSLAEPRSPSILGGDKPVLVNVDAPDAASPTLARTTGLPRKLAFDLPIYLAPLRKATLSVLIDDDKMDISLTLDDEAEIDRAHLDQEILKLSQIYGVTLRQILVNIRQSGVTV